MVVEKHYNAFNTLKKEKQISKNELEQWFEIVVMNTMMAELFSNLYFNSLNKTVLMKVKFQHLVSLKKRRSDENLAINQLKIISLGGEKTLIVQVLYENGSVEYNVEY